MGTTVAGVIFILSLIAALAVAYRYLGDYMYRVVADTRHNRVIASARSHQAAQAEHFRTWASTSGRLSASSSPSRRADSCSRV